MSCVALFDVLISCFEVNRCLIGDARLPHAALLTRSCMVTRRDYIIRTHVSRPIVPRHIDPVGGSLTPQYGARSLQTPVPDSVCSTLGIVRCFVRVSTSLTSPNALQLSPICSTIVILLCFDTELLLSLRHTTHEHTSTYSSYFLHPPLFHPQSDNHVPCIRSNI